MQNCFIEFCNSAEILDPTDPKYSIEESNFLLGCFVISLLQGDNIIGIKEQSKSDGLEGK